mgnify:CR=1 FL=1
MIGIVNIMEYQKVCNAKKLLKSSIFSIIFDFNQAIFIITP